MCQLNANIFGCLVAFEFQTTLFNNIPPVSSLVFLSLTPPPQPLIQACRGGHKDVVQLLLKSGADQTIVNKVGVLCVGLIRTSLGWCKSKFEINDLMRLPDLK